MGSPAKRVNVFLHKQTGFPTVGATTPYWIRSRTGHVKRDGRLDLFQKFQLRFLGAFNLRGHYMPTETVERLEWLSDFSEPEWLSDFSEEVGHLRLFRPVTWDMDGNFPILQPEKYHGLWLPESVYQEMSTALNGLCSHLGHGDKRLSAEYQITMAMLKQANGEEE